MDLSIVKFFIILVKCDLNKKQPLNALFALKVRHELKEMQRKAEVDLDMRKKAEAERGEIRKRLEDETNKRTREQARQRYSTEMTAVTV